MSTGLGAGFGASAASASVSEFGAKGAGAGQFLQPHGAAVFQETGDMYVVDTGNARVDSFTAEGVFRFAVGWGVLDGKQELETCTASCRAGISGAGTGQFSSPQGIAIDNNPASESYGDFYVADSRNSRVEKFDPAGDFLLTFGKGVNLLTKGDVCTSGESENCGAGESGFELGEFAGLGGGLAVDTAGTVYVGDFGRVEKFSPEGVFVSQWVTGEGAGPVSSLAVNSTNEVFVIAEGVPGVHRYDAFGTELGSAFDTGGTASALAAGPSGEVFVDQHFDRLRTPAHLAEFEANGTELKTFDVGAEGGSLGIVFGDTIERVYVLNRDGVRLVAVPPPGPFTIPGSEALVDAKPLHAEVVAVIDAEGSPTTYRFEYGETTSYGSETSPAPLSESEEEGLFAPVRATADLTGLKPGTVYHFRAVTENEGGETTVGLDTTFETTPSVLISGEATSQVTPESARLSVEIDPQGSATRYHFEYGLSTAYGQRAPESDADGGAEEVSATHSLVIEHLTSGTVYHYRVVAENAFGTTEGPDRTFTTTSSSGSALADGRVWEMVSPSAKSGSSMEAISEEGGLIESSPLGDALAYISRAPVGTEAEPEGNQSISDTQLVARRRSPGVWETQDITTPHERPAGFHPGRRAEYLSFSSDLSSALVEPFGATPLSPETTERTPYVREPNGSYTPIVTAKNVLAGAKFAGEETGGGDYVGGLETVGAAPDLSSVEFTSPLALTEELSAPEGSEIRSLYRWSGSSQQLQLVSWLAATKEAPETPAASVGDKAFLGDSDDVTRHAVSSDGNRLVYETEGPGGERHLFLRYMQLGKSVQLDIHEDGTSGSGHARFQDASADGHVVYFTDEERLTANATGDPNENIADLYQCIIHEVAGELQCEVKIVTVPIGPKEASEVQGDIIGADESGDRVYFVANGRLTPDAVHGNCPLVANATELPPAATSCNLYVYDAASGETRLVATLSGRDFPDWSSESVFNLMWLTGRVSPNGRYLAFMSQRSLTGYDNRDAQSGASDEEVFEYDFEDEQLTCVSCKRSGARPEGVFDSGVFPGLLVDRPAVWRGQWVAANVPGWTNVGKSGPPVRAPYQSRYLANDGRLFFNSSDNLAPGDANGQFDVYEYEPGSVGSCGLEAGCVALMSSGRDGGETAFLDAGNEGEDVFFLTAAKLSPKDTDAAYDVYDAHVCTVAADCPAAAGGAPPPCETSDACRAAPSPQPDIFGAPASSTFNGAGNLAPPGAAGVVKAKSLTRSQLLAKALKVCRKDAKRKRVSCERRARKRYGAKKSSTVKGKRARGARSGKKGGRR
jgi:hypothetical protein